MDKPIRILHENVIMDPGGIETQLMRIYRNIDRSKIQFDFMVHRKQKGAFDDEIRSLGGRIYYADKYNPLKHHKYVKSMKEILKNHPEYKIILVHSEMSLWPLKVAKKYNVPVRICYSHNGRPNFGLKRILMWFERLFLKRNCTHMFAVSKLAADYTFGKRAVNNGRVQLIKNGLIIDEYRFNQEIRDSKRSEMNLNDKFVVGHVGRFMEQKNHEFLIEIFYELLKIKPNAHLLLVGEGELRNKIELKVEKMGLSKFVTFLGRRKDVNELVMAMDVMLLPSFYEGFPNVAIEAQAASLPIIMSTSITKEANFSEYCHQIDLSEKSETWARKIIDYSSIERKDTSQIIVDNGHSVISTVKWYEELYLKLYSEN